MVFVYIYFRNLLSSRGMYFGEVIRFAVVSDINKEISTTVQTLWSVTGV